MKKSYLIIIIMLVCSQMLFSQNSEKLFDDGISAIEKGNFAKAEEIFTKLADKHPENIEVRLNRGIAYLYLSKFKEAISDMSFVIKAQPGNVNALNYRGLASTYVGDIQSALKDLNKAIKLDPKFAEAYINRGNIHEITGDYMKALDDYNNAEQYSKNNPMVYLQRARILYNLRRIDEAVRDYNKAAELGINSPSLYAERGNAHFKMRNYTQAVEDYTKAFEMDPTDLKSLNNRAVTYFEMGEEELAAKDKELFNEKLMEKYQPIEEIEFTTIQDESQNIQMDIPADWNFMQKISTEEEVEFYITKNDFEKDGYYELGGVFYLIKNAGPKYGAKNESELILHWKEMRDKQAQNFHSYQYVQKRSYPINEHPAELNTVNVRYDEKSPETTVYEFAVAYGNNLLFAYLHTPTSEFEYYKQIFDKMIKSIHYKFPLDY